MDIKSMTTETRNQNSCNLDMLSPLEICRLMNKEDEKVAAQVHEVLPQIAEAITWVTDSLRKGGRLIYIGAGTSGRLGLLDAVECPPTFGTPDYMVQGLMAGGNQAFIKAAKGAEDNSQMGAEDLRSINLTSADTVIGIAASGRTPYVIGGLNYAREIGCKTAAIACNKNSAVGKVADTAIEVIVGPEVLTGSTRLKAGTAQKMILNMISTASMVGIGKVYQNFMVDVMQTNEKLHTRAENIVMAVTSASREQAKEVLLQADGNVKTAIVMLLLDMDAESAGQKLKQSDGHIRNAIETRRSQK